MRSQPRKYMQLVLVVLALGLSQCGKKSKSAAVKITISPPNPIVILGDVTITNPDGSSKTVKGPWFRFSVNIDNQSEDSVTIVALRIEVTSQAYPGSAPVTADFDPGAWNYTNNDASCSYSDFGQFDPGGDAAGPSYNQLPLYITSASSFCNGYTNGGVNPPTTVTFYAGNLTPPPDGSGNYRYTVKVIPEGWFGSRNDPTDRFDGFVMGYTQ